MADAVLRRIRRRCTLIDRAYRQGSAGRREVHAIDISIANLRRVEDTVSAEAMRDIVQSLTDLRSFIIAPLASNARAGFHAAHRLHSGMFHCFGMHTFRSDFSVNGLECLSLFDKKMSTAVKNFKLGFGSLAVMHSWSFGNLKI